MIKMSAVYIHCVKHCTNSKDSFMGLMKQFFVLSICLPSTSSPVYAQSMMCQVNGTVVSCPPVVCPGDQVTFTWNSSSLIGNKLWKLPNGTCSTSDTPDEMVMPQLKDYCRDVSSTCGPFTAKNIDPGPAIPCLASNLTVIISPNMPSSLIQFGTTRLSGQIVSLYALQLTLTGKNI